MSEVIDKPDAETKDIVARAIKNAQDFAKKNAEEQDKWLVDWTLYCGIIPLETVTAKAKKVADDEWEGVEEVVFSSVSACMLAAHPRWMPRSSPKVDIREKLGQGQCVRGVRIRAWSVQVKNGEAYVKVAADGEIQG